MKRLIFLLCLMSSTYSLKAQTTLDSKMSSISTVVENHPDYNLVKAAMEDYLYGLYEVSPKRIANSVDTTLSKVGYWYNKEKETYFDNARMSYKQLYHLAGEWNKDGSQVNKDSPREITIYEINDKTAIGKLEAAWGIDYFQLAKVEGKWKIYNVMWQSLPIK